MINIPRFQEKNLTKYVLDCLTKERDIKTLFTEFSEEVLCKVYSDFHLYRGKPGTQDGAIDFSAKSNQSYIYGDIKHISQDGLESARSAWYKVSERLKSNLPKLNTREKLDKYQQHYSPWLDSSLTDYIFCISSQIDREYEKKELEQTIEKVFNKLAEEHLQLEHLQKIKVTVFDWSDFIQKLKERPEIVFRWFKGLLPSGWYLFNQNCYHSRPHYYRTLGIPNKKITESRIDEELQLLVETSNKTGLIIVDKILRGKRYLSHRISWYAGEEKNWLVIAVQDLNLEKLKEFAIQVGLRKTPILLLLEITNPELDKNFIQFIKEVHHINIDHKIPLYYMTTCLNSNKNILSTIDGYYEININTLERTDNLGINQSDSEIQIRQLNSSSVNVGQIIDDHSGVDLNAFSSYAIDIFRISKKGDYNNHISDDFYKDPVFINFIEKIVQRIVGENTNFGKKEIAQWCVLGKLELQSIEKLRKTSDKWSDVSDTLANSGLVQRFINKISEQRCRQYWAFYNQYLADQIIINHFNQNPYTAELFLQEIIALAGEIECRQITIENLQRFCQDNNLQQTNSDLYQEILRIICKEETKKINKLLTLKDKINQVPESLYRELNNQFKPLLNLLQNVQSQISQKQTGPQLQY